MKLMSQSLNIFGFASLLCAATFATAAPAKLEGRIDKLDHKVGETMTFTYTVTEGDAPEGGIYLHYVREGDDGISEKKHVPITPDAPVVIKTQSDRPGFVRIWGKLVDRENEIIYDKEVRFVASAGTVIDQIKGIEEPADFDAFWAKQKAKLATIKMENVVREPIPDFKLADTVDAYKLSIPCAGPRPTTGFLYIPKAAQKASMPVRVQFHGYGIHGGQLAKWSDDNQIVLNINAHGFELVKDKDFYVEFGKKVNEGGQGGGYGFNPEENKDPEKTYFNHMILRDLRALEYAKTLPEWNGKDLIVSGGSQGGFQALVMAGLDHDVTLCDAAVPWLCDMGGRKQFARKGGWQPAFTDALNYYDPLHFAKRIPQTCKVFLSRVGLGDSTCTASGITAVYNVLTCPKKIRYVQGSEHMHWGKQPSDQEWTLRANFN